MNSNRTYDIFLSYPHKDKVEVAKICKALHDKGLNVWMDETKIPDYASITRSIVDGLARSRVLVAYNSLNYAHSRACQWELTAAFLAAQREGDPRQRVLIINPEENANHIHPVELRDELFQKAPADQQGIDSLAASVVTHVSAIEGTIGEIRGFIQPRWFGKKGTGSNRFIGRLPDMWHIHSSLHSAEVPIITGATSTTVQIHGMGGLGKSLLAEEYALRYAAAFPGGVFWLRAFGNDDVKTALGPNEREAERIRQFRDIAEAYGILVKDISPEEIEAHLARELGNNGPFLWVVDDMPSGMDVETLERWLAPHPLGKTIITTRTREYNSLGHLILLDVLAPDEAWELLTSWRKPAGEEEEVAAPQLIEDLGRHALALDVAGAALHASEGFQSFAEFREELANPTWDELELAAELKGVLPNGHEKSIASTLIRSIERLGPEGWDFLRLASVLAVAPIPASLISSVFSEVDGLDGAEGRRRAVLGLDQAENLSLVERVEDESGAKSVHLLISWTVRFHDTQPERTDQVETAAIKMLNNELSKVDYIRVQDELRLAVTHARVLVSRIDDIRVADLMSLVARFDYGRGAYGSAENLLRRPCELQRTLLGVEHPKTLIAMNDLALTLLAQGDLEGARKIYEQVLEISRRVLGAEHPEMLTSMNNLASTLHYQGDIKGARKIHEQVLEIRQRVLGAEHSNTVTSMGCLATTLYDQGDIEGARKILEQVLEISCRVLGAEHPNTLTFMNNLAGILHDQGDIEGARKIHEQVLEISRRVLGTEHPNTLTSMNNLALTFRAHDEMEGAKKILEQVLEISHRVLGEEHPDTLMSMNNLATTLRDQGDLEGARKTHAKVLEIRRRVMGEEHPDTLMSMNNLATTLRDQGDLEGARKTHAKVLEIRRRVMGEEHPDTLMSMNNLATILKDQGDLEGARKTHEQVLEIRRNVLGAEHPDALGSMNNLAETLRAQGDLEGARKTHAKVLEIMRRLLGEEHPDTSTSAWNLFLTLREMGDVNEAKTILEKHLVWLLDRDPESLGAYQRLIREMIIKMFQGAGLHE